MNDLYWWVAGITTGALICHDRHLIDDWQSALIVTGWNSLCGAVWPVAIFVWLFAPKDPQKEQHP